MSRRNLSKQPKFIHPAAKSRWKETKRGTWTSTSRNRQLPPAVPEAEPEHDNPSTPQMDTPPTTTPETREEEPEIDMNNTDNADLANVDYDIPTDADVFREAEQQQQPTRHIIGGQDLVNFMYLSLIHI